MYAHAKRSPTHVNDPAVHVRVQWTMEKKKEKEKKEKKSMHKKCQSLQSVDAAHYTEEEAKERVREATPVAS